MKKILTLVVVCLSMFALPNIASACGSCGDYNGYSSYSGYSYPVYTPYQGFYSYPNYYNYPGYYSPGVIFGISFGYWFTTKNIYNVSLGVDFRNWLSSLLSNTESSLLA